MRLPLRLAKSRIVRVGAGEFSRHIATRAIIATGLLGVALSIAVSLVPAPTAVAATGINKHINFQGKLVNTDGTNVTNGTYNIEFQIYTGGDGCEPGGSSASPCGATGGTSIWTEDWLRNAGHGVVVQDGLFQLDLGTVSSLPATFNNDTVWLSINLGNTNATCTPFASCSGDGEMLPFIRFTAAPYAMNSDLLDGLDSSSFAQLSPASAQSGYLNVTGNISTTTGNISTTSGNISASSGTVSGSTVAASTGLQAPLLDTASAVTLNIGTGTASQVTIGRTSTPFLIQGNSSATFTSTASGNVTTVGFTAATHNTTLNFPASGTAGSYTICTSDPASCSGTYATSGGGSGFLQKDAADTSNFAVTASNYLYGFRNSSSAVASGVLKLDNSTNTGNTLYVTASGNPGSGSALIVANNTTGSPSGNLLDLQKAGASEFSVDYNGNVSQNGGTSTTDTINGQTISSAASFTGTVTAATSVLAPLVDTASGIALAIGTNNATAINLNQNTTVATGKTFTANGTTQLNTSGSATTTIGNTSGGAVSVQSSGAVGIEDGTTGTGVNIGNTTSNPNVTIAGSGNFSTTTGNNNLNGNTTVANGKSFTAGGSALFQDSANSTSAFQIQSSGGANLLTANSVDTLLTSGANFESTGYFDNGVGGIGQFGNLVQRSEQFDNAAWTKNLSGTAGTANTAVAPDGQTTADTIHTTTNGGNLTQSVSGGNNTYTLSVWLKTAASTQNVDLEIDSNGTPSAGTAKTVTATTTWQRFFVSQTFSSGVTNVIPTIFPGTASGTDAQTVYAWGGQLVQAGNPEVYVRTTGAAVAASAGVVSNGGLFASSANASDIPIIVQGDPGQLGDLLQAQDSGGTALFKVSSVGAVTSVGLNATTGLIQGTGGATVTGTVQVNASGAGATTIGNASSGALTVAAGANSSINIGTNSLAITSSNFNVSTGGVLNVVGGAAGIQIGGAAPSGHYLRGNGTSYVDSTIQSGDLPSLVGTYLVNTPTTTSDNTINPGANNAVALTVRGSTNGATPDILDVRDSGGNLQDYFDSAGSLNVAQKIQPTSGNSIDLGTSGSAFKSAYLGTSVVSPSYTGAGAVSVTSGAASALTITANAASTWSTGSGALTVDSAAALNLGTSNATSVKLGKSTTTTEIDGTTQLGASAGSGALLNNGSTVNSAYTMADLPTGGWDAGGAAATVDIYTYIAANQTTNAGQTLTPPNPTAGTTYGRVIYVSNIGNKSFLMLGTTISPGTTATLVWAHVNGGDKWTFAGADGSSILNQNSITQTANFKINGTGEADTSVLTALLDTPAAVTTTLNIATSTATTVNIGSTGSATKGTAVHINDTSDGTNTQSVAVGSSANANNSVNIEAGNTGKIQIGNGATTHTIQVGTGAAAQTVTVGSTNTTSTTNIQAGTGNTNIKANNSNVAAPMLSLQQAGGGDASVEFRDAATSWYAGPDASNSDAFNINSNYAAAFGSILGDNYTSQTPNNQDANANFYEGTKFTASSSGTISQLSAAFNFAVNGSSVYSLAIYSDSSGTPSALLGQHTGTNVISAPNAGGINWNSQTLDSPVSVTNGTNYWIVLATNDVSGFDTIHPGPGSSASKYLSGRTPGTWCALWNSGAGCTGTQTASTDEIGLYGTVSATLSDTFSNPLFTMSTSGQANFRNVTNSSTAFQVQNAASTNLFQVDTLNSIVNVGATGSTALASTVNLATSSGGVETVNVGSTNSTSVTTIQGGTGTGANAAIRLSPAAAGDINIGTTTGTGQITVGQSTQTNTISIGSATVAGGKTQTISIGNGAGAGTAINVNILSGVGTAGTASLQMANNPRVTTIDLGNVANAANRTTTIAGGNTPTGVSDTVNIATGNTVGTGTKVVHIADGNPAGTNAVTIGSNTATNNVTILQGGNGTIAGTGAAVQLGTAAAGDLTIGTAAHTGIIAVGQSTAGETINIGNGNVASGNTNNINIGATATSTGKDLVTVGSMVAASATTIQGGTGNITLQTNQAGAGTIVKSNTTNSVSAFQIQNSTGGPLVNADTTTQYGNLITNPGGEAAALAASDWSGTFGAGATDARNTGNAWSGAASISVATTGSANSGAKNVLGNVALASSTAYSLTFYAKASGSNFATLNVDYLYDGTNSDGTVSCTGNSVVTGGWTRYSCYFTTSASGTHTKTTNNAIAFYQSDAATRTFYLDGVQLQQVSTTANAYGGSGALRFDGVVTAPVSIENSQDSTNALSVVSAAGNALLTADTLNSKVTNTGTEQVGASAGTGALVNNGTTQNTTLAITDKNYTGSGNSGAIGTAAATVDIYTSFTINQSTASQTLTVPTPTAGAAAAVGRVIYIANIGSASFTLLTSGATLNPNSTATLVWNGTQWSFAGADGSSILNQNAVTQSANFKINGTGSAATIQGTTAVQSILFDSLTATTLNIGNGTANATGVSIGKSSTTTTVNGALAVNGNTTVGTAGSSVFQNNGATLETVSALGDLASGSMGTAASTVDVYSAFTIAPTASGRTYTVQNPTGAVAGRVVYISNAGSNSFSLTATGMSTVLINPNVTATLLFNGVQWTYAGVDASNLQAAYNNSVGGTTPAIAVSTSKVGVTIQNSVSNSLGAGVELFGVRSAAANDTTLGNSLLRVTSYGVAVNVGTILPASLVSTDDVQIGDGTATARTIAVTDQGTAANAGAQLTVQAAAGNTTGTGGTLALNGGAGGNNGQGGQVTITGGAAGGGNNAGGAVQVSGGTGAGTAAGGQLTLQGGAASSAGSASGALTIKTQDVSTSVSTTSTASSSGALTIQTGVGGANTGANVSTSAGGSGADLQIIAGAGGNASTGPNGNGGNIRLTAGNAGSGTGTAGVPGVVYIDSPVFTSNGQTFTQTGNNQAFPAAGAETTTLQSNVDGYGTIEVNVAGAFSGATIAIPSPRNTAAGHLLYIVAAQGSAGFTLTSSNMPSFQVSAGDTATLVWNGSFWTAGVAASSLQQVYNATSTSPASIVTTSATKNLLFQAGSGFDNANLFQVGNSVGAQELTVDTTNTATGLNLMPNSGAETASGFTTTYPAAGFGTTGTSEAQTTTSGQYASGAAGVLVTPTAATSGLRANLGAALAINTVYNISFSVKSSTSWTNDIDVRYNRTGTTSDGATAVCSTASTTSGSTFNTRTITTTGFTKVVCYITTSGTVGDTTANIAIFQTASATRTIYVDNIAVVAQNSTGTQDVGDLSVGGNNGQGLTLLTLDSYANTPWTGTGNTALLGSMYYDTTAGLIKCYQASGWGTCGAAPNNNTTLVPEYAGAVLHGTTGTGGGSDTNTGTLTANLCANTGSLTSTNAIQPPEGTICASGELYHFYRWTSTQTNAQTYDIYVRSQLPPTFKSFSTSPFVVARVSSTTDASVTASLYAKDTTATTDGTSCGSGVSTSSANTWQNLSVNTSSCSFNASDWLLFKIDVSSKNNSYAYASNVSWVMTGK